MPRNTPQQPLGTVLTLLRQVQKWPQNELATALGCSPTLVCDYEADRKSLSRKRLDAIVAVLGLPPEAVDRTLTYLTGIRSLSPPEGGTAGLGESAEAFVAQMSANAEALGRSFLRLDDQRRAREARHDARFLWERLKPLAPAQRRAHVEASQEFRTWALCELVCEKSLEAAADRADRALDLATLAVRIAERVPGVEDWRMRLHGYALAHLANARRVGSDLPGAEKTFAKARKLWAAGAAAGPQFLQEALIPGLEASLRIDQRRLNEALALVEEALSKETGPLRRHLLINRAGILEMSGDLEGSIAVLQEVALSVSAEEPRLLWVVLFNLVQNLLEVRRPQEVVPLLIDLRQLTAKIGNDLDTLRFQWLEGRTLAYLSQKRSAIAILARVRESFTAQRIAYDAALITLELAVLLLEEGRTKDVRALSRQSAWIFSAQGVHHEALASFRLFCQAVEREIFTLEMAQKMVAYFYRARHNPELRFEP